jgi:hypothetical protein
MRPFSSFVVLVLVLVAPPVAAAPVFHFVRVAMEGDSVPGVGLITRIDNLAVNNAGNWLLECDTDALADSDQVVIRNGVLDRREGELLTAPAGARISSFGPIHLNESGDSGWNFFLDGTAGTNDDSGIFRNAELILQEGTVSGSPAFSAGTRYIGFFGGRMSNDGRILVVASIEDTAITSTVDRALVVFEEPPAVHGTWSETVLWKEGDVLPGQTEAIADFGTGPHQWAWNDAGQTAYFADLGGATTTDGTIYRDGTLIAQEGGASPVAGRTYELLSSRALDLNNAGQLAFKANLDGTTTDDELIVLDGAEFVREGGSIPAIGGFQFTAFGTGPLKLDDDGNLLWWGDWNDPNTDKDTGLFWNDVAVITEGDAIGTDIIDEIVGVQDGFTMSDDGRWILFEATLPGGIDAAYLVEVTDATAVDPQPARADRALWASPNPSSGAQRVHFRMPHDGHVRLEVFDLAGRRVATLVDGARTAGDHEVAWAGRDAGGHVVSAGVYLARLTVDGARAETRIARVR